MWLVPLFALLFYMVFQRITYAIEAWLLRTGRMDESTAFFGLPMAGARSMLETVITLNLSFLVFTFGSLLVAIQVAGGQYTPRIIATTLLRDNVIRGTVGCFVFTLVFALRVLTRMDDVVHQFNILIAAMLGLFSIMVFLYLIDYAARFLRPVSIVAKVGKFGVDGHPERLSGTNRRARARPATRQARAPGPDRRQRRAPRGWCSPWTCRGWSGRPGRPTGSSNSSRRWVTSWRSTNRCSGCTAAPAPSTIVGCGRPSCSEPSARWSRIRRLPSASWSISRSRRCRRRSTIRRRP